MAARQARAAKLLLLAMAAEVELCLIVGLNSAGFLICEQGVRVRGATRTALFKGRGASKVVGFLAIVKHVQ